MPSVIATHTGRYAVLTARETPIGILLEDPEHNALYVRLRRDWAAFADDEERELLELLEDDLIAKARDLGADGVLSWLQGNTFNQLHVAGPGNLAPDDSSSHP